MRLKGSVRSGGVAHILELMRGAEKAFVEFGGHSAAGGFTVEDTEVFFLEERLNAAYEMLIKNKSGDANVLSLAGYADAHLTI